MSPSEFFAKYAPFAMSTQINHGVPASITLAQAALESGWGQSSLAKSANNFFGIKADKSWHGDIAPFPTKEFQNGAYVTVNSNFRKYPSAVDSFNDHALFLRDNSRYKNLFSFDITDYSAWAGGLQSAGYATDPTYSGKLVNMIRQYNLNIYDQQASKKKSL